MLPAHLYRYRPWPTSGTNRAKTSLWSCQFYFARARDFDDVHDGHRGAEAVGDHFDMDRFVTMDMLEIPPLLRKYRVGSIITKLTKEIVTDAADRRVLARVERRHRRRDATVLCFAEEPTNELMWALYGDRNTGICFEFSTAFDPFDKCIPVVYLRSPTDLDHFIGEDLPPIDPLLCAKSQAWSFQKEWRLVDPSGRTRVLCFSPRSLTGIYVGYRFPQPEVRAILSIIERRGFKPPVYRIERHPYSYSLMYRQIDGT